MNTPPNKKNDPCRHCGTPVIEKVSPFKLKKLTQAYFFTHLLRCPGCGAIYNQPRWKITKAEVLKILNKTMKKQI